MPHRETSLFNIGSDYTRDEIYAIVGGSKQTYLPTKEGVVVAACLKIDLNPRAPNVVLCGNGKLIARAGDLLANQRTDVPVFLKRAVNHWEYQGKFTVASSHTTGTEFENLIAGSRRDPSTVSRVILLQPVHHT